MSQSSSQGSSNGKSRRGAGMDALGRKFERLKGQQDALERVKSQTGEDDGSGPIEKLLCKNLDDRVALAWLAQATRARSVDEITIKAAILEEWCVLGDGDIAHELCFSLCRDILLISEELRKTESSSAGGA